MLYHIPHHHHLYGSYFVSIESRCLTSISEVPMGQIRRKRMYTLRLIIQLTEPVPSHDLPPTAFARPLAVGKTALGKAPTAKDDKPKRKARAIDDTPKEFARLMQYTKAGKRPNGLDNGTTPKTKKRKRVAEGASKPLDVAKKVKAEATPSTKTPLHASIPKIMPGERMSDYSARVDQALPISGLSRKSRKIDGMKERQTRIEKKIQRRIADWRKDEEKLKDKEEEARDLADLEDAEHGTIGGAGQYDEGDGENDGGQKKKRKRGGGSKEDQEDSDIWAKLKLARERPAKVSEQAQAPPTFKRIPKEIFKTKNGALISVGSVPKSVGSLRRREELEAARQDTIEKYRKMMEEKRV